MKKKLLFFISLVLFVGQLYSSQEQALPEKPIVVVIASYKNADWYKRNLDSVFEQNYNNYRIVYVDDCSPDGTGNLVESYVTQKDQWHRFTLIKNKKRRLKMANTYMAYHEHCKDEEIVVELDGDDWTSHKNVLANINKIYSTRDVWMTYGHFMEWPTGRPQIMRSIPQSAIDNRTVRKLRGCMWAGMRTYYGWLIKRVKLEDLLYQGRFLAYTSDAAIMFPMFDMSGNRFAFVTDDMWLQHNVKTPLNDHKVDKHGMSYRICQFMRAKPPYPRHNESRIGFIDALDGEKVDVLVFADKNGDTGQLFNSFECHAKNIGEIFVVNEGSVDKEFILKSCLESENKYLLLVKDGQVLKKDIDLNLCVKLMEETGAYGFFLGVGKNGSSCPLVHEKIFDDFYGWQFKYGKNLSDNACGVSGTVYRKTDAHSWIDKIRSVQDLDRLERSKEIQEKVGLFFESAVIDDNEKE